MYTTHDHNDLEILRETLIGRSVVLVQVGGTLDATNDYGEHPEGKVVLDNGTELFLAGNTGGCICGAGEYTLTQLNYMPMNGITNVEIVDEAIDREYEDAHIYRIFVLAQDERFELATFEGDDGNGYYGTGFWFKVKP